MRGRRWRARFARRARRCGRARSAAARGDVGAPPRDSADRSVASDLHRVRCPDAGPRPRASGAAGARSGAGSSVRPDAVDRPRGNARGADAGAAAAAAGALRGRATDRGGQRSPRAVRARSGHPVSTLGRVRAREGAEHAECVLPLDDETSGVCLFARRAEHVAQLTAAVAAGRMSYVALARGIVPVKGSLRGERHRPGTRFARRAVVGGHSLVRLTAEGGGAPTGRQLASLGHELLGDSRYGHPPSSRHLWERAALNRTFLHAERLELRTRPAR